jgi:hypothetical protein
MARIGGRETGIGLGRGGASRATGAGRHVRASREDRRRAARAVVLYLGCNGSYAQFVVHSEAAFSHGICQDCLRWLSPEFNGIVDEN